MKVFQAVAVFLAATHLASAFIRLPLAKPRKGISTRAKPSMVLSKAPLQYIQDTQMLSPSVLEELVTPPATFASAHGVTTTGSVKEQDGYLNVQSSSETSYNYYFVNDLFDIANPVLADQYREYGRCLCMMDTNLEALYADKMHAYFKHHNLPLTIAAFKVTENEKTMRSVEAMLDAMKDFNLNRQEPVLLLGGGLITDMGGFACSMMRRNTPYIRIPTSLIGLVDASIAIKVACNHEDGKNKIGAFHAHQAVLLDTTFLATLPTKEIRVGMAEIIKITTVEEKESFELLEKYVEEVVETKFGHVNPDGKYSDAQMEEIKEAGGKILYKAIHRMLELESPNLQELNLDRAIAFGHTWSPEVELVAKYRYGKLIMHGQAVAMDMALSMTLAARRGLISARDRDRVHTVISKVGLMLDHEAQRDPEVMRSATKEITKTRNGLLRAAVPVGEIGQCTFLNDVSHEELMAAIEEHKMLVKAYPREGEGIDYWIKENEELADLKKGRFEVTPFDRIMNELNGAALGRSYREVGQGIEKVSALVDGIDKYVSKYSSQPSEALQTIAAKTAATNDLWSEASGQTSVQMEAEMISGQPEVQLLKILAQFGKVKSALDVGTFTGLTAVGMAEALPADGRVVTLEREQIVADMAREHFALSEHGSKIECRVGAVADSLDELVAAGEKFQLVFIDADKPGYLDYYEKVMNSGLLEVGGMLVMDSVMYKGMELAGDELNENAQGVKAVNEAILADERLTKVMLPLRDGVTVAYRSA